MAVEVLIRRRFVKETGDGSAARRKNRIPGLRTAGQRNRKDESRYPGPVNCISEASIFCQVLVGASKHATRRVIYYLFSPLHHHERTFTMAGFNRLVRCHLG
jgi:hypothetical protein